MNNVLLAEDDTNLGFVIKDNLELNGFAVRLCADGETAWQSFQQQVPDICVLDIMLPGKDGITLARHIRQANALVPILFLTARSMQEDLVSGFKAGGDDYITKPFSMEELLLRMNVFLRRSLQTPPENNDVYRLGKYQFDYPALTLRYEHKTRLLTQKEADILRCFCLRKNEIVRREDILQAVWGSDDYFLGRSLDVFISKLRKYLQDDPQVEIINLHGIGFKLSC